MVIQNKKIRADISMVRLIDEVVAKHRIEGRFVSISKVTKKIAEMVEKNKEELLNDEFIRF